MFFKKEIDVLVAGAGPVGLFSALALSEQGLRVQIVDEQYRTAARSYALALHPSTLELLDRHGLAGELVAKGNLVDSLAFYDRRERVAELHYSSLGCRFPFLLVLPQQALEEALERRLTDRKVKVEWSHHLAGLKAEGKEVSATLQSLVKESAGYSVATSEWVIDREYPVRAPFVVAADGHRSTVRRSLGIEYQQTGAPQTFAVFEVTTAEPVEREVRVVFDGALTSVMWPLGERHCRWGFELSGEEIPQTEREKSRLCVVLGDDTFNYLDPGLLKKLLAERAPWFRAPVEEVAWSMALRFERKEASEYGRKTVCLIGDAAHIGAPVAMQSMNQGIAEAAEVAEQIRAVSRGDATVEKLEAGSAERQRRWRALQRPQVLPEPTAGFWAKTNGERLATCLPASGDHLVGLLKQLGLGLAR